MHEELVRLVRDTFYVGVGFGVLGVQKLQVRRREVEKVLDHQLAGPRERLGRVFGHGANGSSSDAPS